MRTIKFRAWDKSSLRWIKIFAIENDGSFLEFDYDEYHIRWTENIHIMQYTGLQDCKGNPVYEGDIVYGYEGGDFGTILSKWHGVVYWNEDEAGFYVKDDQENLPIADYAFDEVVGNIFEDTNRFLNLLSNV